MAQVSNRTIDFSIVTGTVISSQKRSETHVRSSGGGGFLHQGTGHVRAPTIHSTVITKHEFWIRTKDEQDVPVQLTAHDVPVAEGQTMSVISASTQGLASPVVLLLNHNAKAHWFIAPNSGFINSMHEPIKIWPFLVTGALFVGPMVGIMVSHFMFLWFCGSAFLGYRLYRRKRLAKASTERLRQHVEKIAQSVYADALSEPRALPALAPLSAA